ncbi:hypothetical protein SEA_LEOPARD_62 [Mycobacterium phage Leopard]|uniref:Uncharacterized protein n=1 Tax=Mycobacterium phage Onyinye TaxID=2686235 RepID=A0A6B9LD24_9CAUD|nr:hypothetical protein PP339_gp063 [Mycobacterium phage Onyinye]QHB37468.1 hypothetical protein SEA_ONYINYE_63 [Mycobacterium phage Onyinye]UOW92939.1 hypothetical protein SEA_LEOPARD_62 [Mycobacterium phage Leopard]WKW85225.1 hypothetical protein SEA_AIKOY__63 [Mycobacterium phage Aikoy]
MSQVYVEFPGGAVDPEPYVVPCEVVKEIPGWAKVVLRPAPPRQRHDWSQWVRKQQILTENDVEMG